MRLKIALASLFLIIIGGIYTASSLPFFTDTAFHRDYIVGYMPLLRKGLSVLMILVAAYGASVSFNLILTKIFVPVIRGNALAKKVFPLIHWAISIAVWIVAVFFVLGTLGVNLGALITGAGIGGVLFALASKEFIANLFGSLSLIFSHNFKIGDTIKVKGYEWTVDQISLSYTRLIDRKGTVIFMPNKLIISETVENISMAPSKKAEFAFDIPAGISVKETKRFLKSLESDLSKIEERHGALHMKISIENITGSVQNILVRIESENGDIPEIRKEVWFSIKECIDGIKKD